MLFIYLYLFVIGLALLYHYFVYSVVFTSVHKERFVSSDNWRSLFLGFILALSFLVIRQFVINGYNIPTPSMQPNYPVGSMVFAYKSSFGVRSPFSNDVLIPTGLPQRGEPIILKNPRNPEATFLKRVIGLPGDFVEFKDQRFYINGKPLNVTEVPEGIKECSTPDNCYLIQVDLNKHTISDSWQLTSDQYFVAGDNRDDSVDSREWGPVLSSHLLGKVIN